MTVRRTGVFVAVFGLRTIGHARPSGQKVAKGSHAGTRQEREIYTREIEIVKHGRSWECQRGGISRKNEDQGRSWGRRRRGEAPRLT